MTENIQNYIKVCAALRTRISEVVASVDALRSAEATRDVGTKLGLEMDANIELAYRHLEDARMRLGKAIQAADGGTSVYDKEAKQ